MKDLENNLDKTFDKGTSSSSKEEGTIYKIAEKIFKIRKTISNSQPNWYKALYGIYHL
jgi:hypothetical protein